MKDNEKQLNDALTSNIDGPIYDTHPGSKKNSESVVAHYAKAWGIAIIFVLIGLVLFG